ncbi:MAG: EscU/YscU/HrcU family type III secretion system export apparatus switch protein [Candidatus Coatesbacteria bacterium]|nr:EscU/YscU/HrcU family type III secretion system export apparatus switch protein [Candidatus Coatesbacteria bacterium]
MPEDNKPRKATALGYDPSSSDAPRLIAKGAGHLAEKIIQIAREHDIPIKEDADLVEALMQLDVEETIPPELYKAVAEILAFIYAVNESWKEKHLSDIST